MSAQLTLRDYCIFKSIESSEYIDYYFKKTNSKYGHSHLTQFSDLSNEEMFWVVNEILHESNLVKRAKIIKLFIQIAHICKECKNFNSLLAILQGLDHLTVARLKETWEKVPNKYKKILEDLRILLDTSKNMLKYRQVLKSEFIQPPIVSAFALRISLSVFTFLIKFSHTRYPSFPFAKKICILLKNQAKQKRTA